MGDFDKMMKTEKEHILTGIGGNKSVTLGHIEPAKQNWENVRVCGSPTDFDGEIAMRQSNRRPRHELTT